MVHPSRGVCIAAVLTAMTGGPAVAASCMDDVQSLTRQLGLSPNARAQVPSRLSETPAPGGNPIAERRSEVIGLLEAARAASAQGDEAACNEQLAKVQSVLRERQP